MKRIKIQPLTPEAFAPFGTYTSVLNPEGEYLAGPHHKYYRENSRYFAQTGLPIGLSPIVVDKQPMKIDAVEYHNYACEAILPINDDAIVHVTPAGGAPDTAKTKAFLVPKGTMITLFPGVYHLCPLPAAADKLNALILLPERTHNNDFTLVELPADQQFQITK